MKFKPKEIAVPALILCAICLIITGALSVTNFITKDTIEALNLETEKSARTVVLPDAANFEAGDSEESYFIGKADDGSEKGYVFTTTCLLYTSFAAVTAPTPLMAPEERYFKIAPEVAGLDRSNVSALNWSPKVG